MKPIRYLAVAMCLPVLWLLILTSCATFESTAYKSIGTAAYTVDTAMSVWGDYVRSGVAKPINHNGNELSVAEQEAAVRSTYETYQQTMFLARSAILAYKDNPDLAFPEQTINLLTATASDLALLIQRLTAKEVNP